MKICVFEVEPSKHPHTLFTHQSHKCVSGKGRGKDTKHNALYTCIQCTHMQTAPMQLKKADKSFLCRLTGNQAVVKAPGEERTQITFILIPLPFIYASALVRQQRAILCLGRICVHMGCSFSDSNGSACNCLI